MLPESTDMIERMAVSQDVWDKLQVSTESVASIDTTGGVPIYLEPFLPPGFFIEYYRSGRLAVRRIDNTLSN